MNIILILRTTTCCKIAINEFNLFIDKNEKKKISLYFNDKFYLQVFPIDSDIKYTSFISMIKKTNHTIESCSNQINIINYSNNTYEIVINPNVVTQSNNTQVKRKIKNPQEKEVFYYKDKLQIKSNTKTAEYNINFNLTNPQISFTDNIILLSSKENWGKHLYVVNEINNKIRYFFCDSFKLENRYLTIVKKFKDYANHLKIEKYDLNNNFNKIENYTALEKEPKIITNLKIIPYAFMQNIQARDFKNSRLYLDADFNSSLSNANLKDFFGQFTMITTPQINTDANTICLIYQESDNYYISKYFKFDFNLNNKITNISQTHP